MNRPTGTTWRNWKKTHSRWRIRRGLPPSPENWDAEWEAHKKGKVVAPVLPSPDLTAEEIIAQQRKRFRKMMEYEHARKLITVPIDVEGPYAVLWMGDPHVDDNGCDWDALLRDIKLIQETEGLYVANGGDTRNNWVGRLARLYGEQGTSAAESLILAEYLVRQLAGKWIFLVGGNHDKWSGSDDPMPWLCKQVGALYEGEELRVAMRSPDGKKVTVNAKHHHRGNSMWNVAHAVTKAAKLGVRDDIIVGFHKHTSGCAVAKDPETGKAILGIQVASYKVIDRYQREGGFPDEHLSPCAVTVIDPHDTGPNRITLFWDSVKGAEYLTFLRNKYKAG